MKVFLILLFLVYSIQVCESSSNGWMEPSDTIELKEGAELKLKCIVNQENYSNDKLNFMLDGNPVNETFVRKVGLNTIELIMPNMDVRSSTIICKHNESAIAYIDVRVGTIPTNVTDFKCISNNWNNLTCTFRKPFNPVAVHYSVSYYTQLNKNSKYHCTDPIKYDDGIATCFFDFRSYRRTSEHFTFTLTANNSLGFNMQTFDIKNFAIVVPSQVEDVLDKNVTSHSAVISWKTHVDIRSFPRKLDLEFSIDSKYASQNDSQIFTEMNASTSEISLELPYAHTWYGIKMRMKSQEAKNSEEFWSKWSNIKLFKTEARRPDNPPVMAKGGFNFGPGGDIIYVYWQHLPEQFHNGEDFGYNVYSGDEKHSASKITDLYATFANKFSNDNSKLVVITVNSKNEKGVSEKSSSMTIPSEKYRLPPPRKLVKTLNNEIYNLTWLPPMLGEGVITDYTVFWCSVKSELPNNCDSSINFAYRKPNETFFVYKSNLTINFAIAANSNHSSSGMIWSSCTAANSHEIGKIKTIWIPRLTSTTIEIEWKLECTDSGSVVGYQIEYCPIREPKTLDCREPVQIVNTTTQKHTLENLQPYTTYRFKLRMFSASTMGPQSEPQANTTLEAAPSTVQNLMVREVSNISAELYWDPPEFSNGVLLYYQIWVNSQSFSVSDKVEIGNTNNRMNLTLRDLNPYTEYQISVLACTKDCSIAVSTNMTTTVGNPGVIEQPMIKTFNYDKLSNYSDAKIEWDEPKFKGGEINYYELKITKEVAGNIEETYYKMARKHCIYHELCSNNVKMYGFSIRAINFLSTPHSKKVHHETATLRHNSKFDDCNRNDEDLMEALKKIEKSDPHGSFLKGNWSVPISHSCNSKDLNGAQIAILVGSLIVTLVMLVTFRYFYKEYRRMKDIFPQMPPGLEDLTGEKKKKEKMDQEKIPDILRNVDNTSLNCEDESGKLLKTSRNNSINENDCSSSIRSESTQSEIEQNYIDDISYGAFESNERDHQADSLKQFIINPTTGEEITLSPTMKMTSTPHPPKTSLIMNPKMPLSASSSGYVHPPVKQNPSYVAYSIFNPLQSNTHTTLGAYEKPSILLHNGAVHDKNNLKTPVVATTDQEGISGYVTHRQLSDFGHRMQ